MIQKHSCARQEENCRDCPTTAAARKRFADGVKIGEITGKSVQVRRTASNELECTLARVAYMLCCPASRDYNAQPFEQ